MIANGTPRKTLLRPMAALLGLTCAVATACSEKEDATGTLDPLIPELDRTRRERLSALGDRFVTPPGFSVEPVASAELVGSIINMTFDHLGRPALSVEGAGIHLLVDADSDGFYDRADVFSDEVQSAHGMHYLGPGDLLVNSEGPEGPGLYRLTDVNGDERADRVTLIAASTARIQEHGPHAILRGPDGSYYVLYGNHAHPDVELDPASPSRDLREDHLLPRFLDPRGHANSIRAPGGTIQRLSPDLKRWSQVAAGFRNPFDMAADLSGELFTFDSDMEWDLGLPWYRPMRVAHVIPGGDYGWRTGSGKFPFYYVDTLPSVDDLGRGSPVGMAFYYHHVYPERFEGALFLGDWSRGRIRVVMPEPEGASYRGEALDFVLGEPLNVTDLDVGPDGHLYFSTGGRSTTGGLYRVRYRGDTRELRTDAVDVVLDQPMPRSAWGREAIARHRDAMGARWEPELRLAALDSERPASRRLRALEALQLHGPEPDLAMLGELVRDREPAVRAAAVLLVGTFAFDRVRGALTEALGDADPIVVRRACEALVRAGLEEAGPTSTAGPLAVRLFGLLGHPDRFVRYAARLALMRMRHETWVERMATDDVEEHPRRALEGLLALLLSQSASEQSDLVFRKLDEYSRARLGDEALRDYLRILQLALARDPAPRRAFLGRVGPRLLEQFPVADPGANRELQVVLAHAQTPGAIGALLDYLSPDRSQQEQLHTVYALRAVSEGWTAQQRRRLMTWFDRAWKFRGAASMEGYVDLLWQSALERLTDEERQDARARRDQVLDDSARRAAVLAARAESEELERSDLGQMSFEELSEYLEYDPMAYSRADPANGRVVFYRARCVDCHVFGSEGRGGGPDLSTVVTRFRRREILESIMYPSRVISDQYSAVWVELRRGEAVTGMLADETTATLTLIDASGKRIDVQKREILERRPASVSIMPEGLLEVMTLRDLTDLIVFLERGVEASVEGQSSGAGQP